MSEWVGVDDWLADRGLTERTAPVQPWERTGPPPARGGRPPMPDVGPVQKSKHRSREGLILEGVEHGTHRGYQKGCGCQPFRDANAAKTREYHRRQRQRVLV